MNIQGRAQDPARPILFSGEPAIEQTTVAVPMARLFYRPFYRGPVSIVFAVIAIIVILSRNRSSGVPPRFYR